MISVVCIHGLARSPADWDGVRGGLAQFGRVLTPELPAGSLRHQTDVLARHCPDGSILVGHSLGAIVTLAVAARTRPRAVVLTSGFFPPARNGRTVAASLRDYGSHRLAVLRASRASRARPRLALVPSLMSMAGLGLRPSRFHALAGAVDSRVLVLHGDADHYVPVAFAEAAVGRHASWRLHIAPGAGHELHVDDPLSWVDLTTGFLRSG